MGSFANSMFSVMLGWVRTAADWLWRAMFDADDGLLGWIGENWVGLIVALCIIGMAVDAVVHLLRWRPYKVWASFIRRLFGGEGEKAQAQFSGRMSRVWHYADGTAREEEVVVPEDEWYAQEDTPEAMTSRAVSRRYARTLARAERLNYQEEMKKDQPVKGLEDYPQPREMQPAPPPETRMEGLRKRMARLAAQESVEDELQLRYRPAPPAVDKHEAYRAPYYPPQWKKPAATGAANEEDTHDNAF